MTDTTPALVIVTLRNGDLVLGRIDRYNERCAKTYANRASAEKAAQKVGGEVIQRGRPFYVRVG